MAATLHDHLDNPFLAIKQVSTTSVTLSTTCRSDPPQNIIIGFPNDDDVSAFGFQAITCNGKKQTVVVPLSGAPLQVGRDIFTSVTISGDSGEYNDWGTYRVKR